MTETTSYSLLVGISILPVIILVVYVYLNDKYEKEPIGMLLKGMLFGALSTIPAILLEQVVDKYNVFRGTMPIAAEVFDGFCVAGICEEASKLALLWLCVWRSRHFNDYFDGIVYSACIALGFACVENIGYVFSQNNFAEQLHTGIVRAFLSVPGHFLFGVVMGYYFALAKFECKTLRNIWMAFCIPMLLHGTFDTLLMILDYLGEQTNALGVLLFLAFLWFDIRLWKIARRRLIALQQRSYYQNYSRKKYSNGNHEEFDNSKDANHYGNNDKQQYGGSDDDKNDVFKDIDWNI